MKRRDVLKSLGALLGLGAVARELQPESQPESSAQPESIAPTIVDAEHMNDVQAEMVERFARAPEIKWHNVAMDGGGYISTPYIAAELPTWTRIDPQYADGQLVGWIAIEELAPGDLVWLDSDGRARKARG